MATLVYSIFSAGSRCQGVVTVIWFYFVLYFISYAAVRTKIKRTNIFQQRDFHTCFVYACVASSFTVPCFCRALFPSLLASVLASLLLRECRYPFFYNNSVAISLVTGLSVTCDMRGLLLLQPATLLGTHGNLARNTPFHTHIAVSVSVALHTCVRLGNVLKKSH